VETRGKSQKSRNFVVSKRKNSMCYKVVLSDCATVAVILFQARSIMIYFGLLRRHWQ